MNKTVITLASALSLLVLGCKENANQNNSETKDTTVTTVDSAAQTVNDKEKEFKFLQLVASLPSPAFHVLEFNTSGIKLNEKLCNAVSNSDKYTTPFKQSANYGVYLSDLAYLASFKNEKGVKAYLEASSKMAASTGVKGKFDDIVNNRHFIDYLNNADSLEVIIESIYKATDDFLVSDKHLDMATEVFIGSWIENNYITLASLKGQKQNEKNKAIYSKVYEQKLHIGNILTLLKEFENHADLAAYTKQFEELATLYTEVESAEMVNDAFLAKLNGKIESMRNAVIS